MQEQTMRIVLCSSSENPTKQHSKKKGGQVKDGGVHHSTDLLPSFPLTGEMKK